MNARQYKDLDLCLDAFDNNPTLPAESYDPANCFICPETLPGQEILHFGAPSPDRCSLSSSSEASSGFAPELPELSIMSEYPCLSTNFCSTFEQAYLAREETPRSSQHNLETPQYLYLAEPSSTHSCRASPNTGDRSRSRSSSTSSFVISKTQHSPPFVHTDASNLSLQGFDFSAQDMSPCILASSNPRVDISRFNSSLLCSETQLEYSSLFLPTPCPSKGCQPRGPSTPPSSSLPNVFQSSTQAKQRHDGRVTDFPAPPDLFGPLREDHMLPPDKDMYHSDPDLRPCEQELRFEGDLYGPRFVRGRGNKREGWCGICKPGRWLVLKNSGYWYDKRFSHGVGATGTAFDGPSETRRMEGQPGVWEGLCNSCGKWIALISSKKKGTTWFRHAYKVNLRLPKYVASVLTILTVPYPSKAQGGA